MFIRKTDYEELLNRIAKLEKQIKDVDNKCFRDLYNYENKIQEDFIRRFKIIEDHIEETKDRNDGEINNAIKDKFKKLDSEIDSKIEKAINDLNIEDKVLLKVVKATFNNWNEK